MRNARSCLQLLAALVAAAIPVVGSTVLVGPARAADGAGDAVATVNGVPVRESDVRAKLSRDGHTAAAAPGSRENALAAVIWQELFRQRAVELGLDADPAYQEKLAKLQAQLDAFKRTELSELFVRREIEGKVVVTDAEAQQYFVQNENRIRTELHVWQIVMKGDEGPVEQALKDIRSGTPFEEVARRQFPGLPATDQHPWDLGYLRWPQVPPQWRPVIYDLKKGEVSGVVPGPRKRFWILKLIDKRENASVTFDSLQPTIVQILRGEKIAARRQAIERELHDKARIEYRQGPAAGAVE